MRNESGKPPRPSHRGKRAAGSDDRRKRVRRINRAQRRRDKESASKLAARAIADGRHRRHNDAPQDCEARLAACLAETSDLALRRPCTLQAKHSLTKVSRCTDKFISIGHINIQGVAVIGRISEVIAVMQQRKIKIQILTEAQITGSTVFRTQGYWVFQSGDDDSRSTGICFIICGSLFSSIHKWFPVSGRMALVQLKILGGIFTIIGAYAPYEGIRAAGGRSSEQQRADFFLSLGDLISESARAGPVIATGDFNTSIRWRRTGEEIILAQQCIRR